MARAAAEDFFFGDEREPVGHEDDAARELADDDRDDAALALSLYSTRDAEVTEERREALGLRLGARGDLDAEAVVVPVRDATNERRERRPATLRGARGLHGAREILVVARRQIQRGLPHQLERVETRAFAHRRGPVQRDHAARVEPRGDLVLALEERRHEEMRAPFPHRGASRGAVDGRHVLRRAAARLAERAHDRRRIVEHHDRVGRDVVEERLHLVVERGHVRVRAEERPSARDVVDESARLERRHVDRVGELRDPIARTRDVLARQDRLAHGREHDLGERRVLSPVRTSYLRFAPACEVRWSRLLVHRVERFDRHDEITVELDAHGLREVRRPHVEQAPAHRERARIFDERHANVPGLGEPRDEPVAVEPVLGDHAMRVRPHDRARHELSRERRRGHDEQVGRIGEREPRERRHARHARATIGVHLRVGRCLVVREHERFFLSEEREVVREASRRVRVVRHEDDAPSAARHLRRDHRARAASEPRDVQTTARGRRDRAGHVGELRRLNASRRQDRLERIERSVHEEGAQIKDGVLGRKLC